MPTGEPGSPLSVALPSTAPLGTRQRLGSGPAAARAGGHPGHRAPQPLAPGHRPPQPQPHPQPHPSPLSSPASSAHHLERHARNPDRKRRAYLSAPPHNTLTGWTPPQEDRQPSHRTPARGDCFNADASRFTLQPRPRALAAPALEFGRRGNLGWGREGSTTPQHQVSRLARKKPRRTIPGVASRNLRRRRWCGRCYQLVRSQGVGRLRAIRYALHCPIPRQAD